MKPGAIALLLLLTSCVLMAADKSPQSTTTLKRSSASPLTVPSFSFFDAAQCDSAGNLYFNASKSHLDTSILKLSPDGRFYDFYNVPSSLAAETSFLNFKVAPNGDVGLLELTTTGVEVFRFSTASQVPTHTKLKTPDNFYPSAFGYFPSGAIILVGYFDKNSKSPEPGSTFAAIYNASGEFLFRLPNILGSRDLAKESGAPMEVALAAGDDGLMYLLTPTEVVAVTEHAQISKRFRFAKPDSFYSADRIDVSDGLVSIELSKSREAKKPVEVRFLLLDASTGEVLHLLEPTEELGNNMLCFTKESGYSFYRVQSDGNIIILRASIH